MIYYVVHVLSKVCVSHVGRFKFGSSVRDHHTDIYADVQYWQILDLVVAKVDRQTTKFSSSTVFIWPYACAGSMKNLYWEQL